MSFLNKYKTDPDLENNGVWIDFGDDVHVKITRFGTTKSKEVRRRLEKPYQNFTRKGGIPDSVLEEILMKQIAEAIIVDWKGVTDEEGAVLDCTYDNRLTVLKKYPDFRDDVVLAASERDTFKTANVEDGAKNS